MAQVETVFMRGEGGAVIAMDLPLPYEIARRVDKGHIVRVNADGSDYAPPEDEPEVKPAPELVPDEPESDDVAKPKPAEPKAVWVAYAASQGLFHDDADAMTKADLIKRFG